MSKRKDYLKLWVRLCKAKEICYSAFGSGDIEFVYIPIPGDKLDRDVRFDCGYYKIGTKAAYDWLVKKIAEVEG